jgi:hypothetical protein
MDGWVLRTTTGMGGLSRVVGLGLVLVYSLVFVSCLNGI